MHCGIGDLILQNSFISLCADRADLLNLVQQVLSQFNSFTGFPMRPIPLIKNTTVNKNRYLNIAKNSPDNKHLEFPGRMPLF